MTKSAAISTLIVALLTIAAPTAAKAYQPLVRFECSFQSATELQNNELYHELLEKIPEAAGVHLCEYDGDIGIFFVVGKFEVAERTKYYSYRTLASYTELDFESSFLRYFHDPDNFNTSENLYVCVDDRYCDQPFDRGFIQLKGDAYVEQQKLVGGRPTAPIGLVKKFWENLPTNIETYVAQHPNRASARDFGDIIQRYFDPSLNLTEALIRAIRDQNSMKLVIALNHDVMYLITFDNLADQTLLDISRCVRAQDGIGNDREKSDPSC